MMCGASSGRAREPAGRGDPAGVPAHHFQDEHLGRGLGHRGDIERGLARGTATYLATEPKPGQQSVCGRSLSTVFGTPKQIT